MKKILIATLPLYLLACIIGVMRVDAAGFAPQSLTWTNFLGASTTLVSSIAYAESNTVRGTNVLVYSGLDTNSGLLDMNGVDVSVVWGYTVTNRTETNIAKGSTAGVFSVDMPLMSRTGVLASVIFVQVTVTDTNSGFKLVYPRNQMKIADVLD